MPEQHPLPQAENAYAVPAAEVPAAKVAEQSRPSAAQPAPGMPPQHAAQFAVAAQTALGPVESAAPAMPAMADDVDLIEKEWIVKAKEIVERTKDDPRQQSVEMTRVKADYIKKRYDKDVKLDEA
jgi:hypothetical protein